MAWLATGFVAVPAIALLSSCDNGCEQTRESYPHISFVSTSGRQLRSVTIHLLSGDTILISEPITKFEDIDIKINPKRNETDLIIGSEYHDYGDAFSSIDTVKLSYDVEPKFLDLSCGCSVEYTITNVTTTQNLIRRVVVNNDKVFTDSGINLTIEY